MKLASQPLLPASPPFSHLKKLSSSLFAFPLFSQLYELLFPQALCFDNHLNCPGVYPLWSPCSDLRALCVALFSRLRFFRISSSCVFNSLHPLLRSWLSFSSLRSLFSATSSLFLQNTGVGGILPLSLRTSAPSAPLYPEPRRVRYPYPWTFPIDRSTSHPGPSLSTVDYRDFPPTMLKSTRTAYDHP